MADLSLPSAVSLLQERIERRKAEGQRFPKPANSEEAFRSARFAPNEQVRRSVKASTISRKPEHAGATETARRERERDKSPAKKPNNESFSSLPEENSLREETWKGRPAKDANNPFRIGIPQRVEPPKDLNVPVRNDDGTMVAENEGGGGGGGASVAHGDPSVNRRQASQTKIKDQEMLAFACRRANKPRNEAMAYYNMGVLLDNDKELEKANACYEQYLQASRAVGDVKGEQLALNSMAINFFKLGRYEEAIELSNQHLQIADVAGKFVAHCNLGLAYAAMDELEQSSLNHRQALRYAIVMSSVVGESLACGNLGNVAERKGDMRTSKACLERHLKLSVALKDLKAQLDANLLLGKMANEEGQYEEASSYFENAKKIAQELGDSRVGGGAAEREGGGSRRRRRT
mmetsp:Transcript_37243/g.117206  ORF Transcript_37243/g.117206 Transcript_37243/m.117206 type:complete len:405 (-) Transcript_37243:91-1305(-)